MKIKGNIPHDISDFNVGIGTTNISNIESEIEIEIPSIVGITSSYEYKTPHRKSFQELKNTLVKEPEGDVKKNFSVVSINEDAWKYIHELLIADETSEQYIPSEAITCIDEQQHSKTRSIYLLTPTEVEEIKKHPKILNVNICYASYPGTYIEDPNLSYDYDKPNRYERDFNTTIKNYRDYMTAYLPASPTIADVNRCGYQLLRTANKNNPWNAINDATTLTESIRYYGDGTGVDLIVADDACWFMHTEFVNTGIGTHNYVPGNVLNNSTDKGTCGVLDLVLDAPYYIDPTYFDGDASLRITRWDGTVVPTEAAARDWWTDKDARSNVNIMDGVEVDFSGSYYTSYTRSSFNGGNDITTRTIVSSSLDHGTPCASLAYGRTYGWAFNANKWFISWIFASAEFYFDIAKLFHQYKPINPVYGTKDPTISSNSFGYRSPVEFDGVYSYRNNISGYLYYNTINSSDNIITTSGPNIGYINYKRHPYQNNYKLKYVAYNKSAGAAIGGLTDGNEYWVGKVDDDTFYFSNTRGDLGNAPPIGTKISLTSQGIGEQTFGLVSINSGGGVDTPLDKSGVTYSGIDYNSNTTPKFMSNFAQRVSADPADDRAAIRMEMVDNSMTTAGEEMLDAGVIFICSAGNTQQKLVNGDHSDYNNYWYTGTDTDKSLNEVTLSYGGYEYYRTINRPGFPQQIGKKWDGVAGVTTYRTISIGALNNGDIYLTGGDEPYPYYERKASYSNMGNFIRCFSPAEGTLAADSLSTGYARYDDSYTIGSDTAVDSKDRYFNGTSASCPVAAGLIATKLQYKRNWTYDDVMFWIESQPELYNGYSTSACNDSSSWPMSNCVGTSKFALQREASWYDSSWFQYGWYFLNGSPSRVLFDQQLMVEYGSLQEDANLRIVGAGLTISSGTGGLSIKSS